MICSCSTRLAPTSTGTITCTCIRSATPSAVDSGYLSSTLLGSSGHLRVTVSNSKATVEYVRSRLTVGKGDPIDRYNLKPAVRP